MAKTLIVSGGSINEIFFRELITENKALGEERRLQVVSAMKKYGYIDE